MFDRIYEKRVERGAALMDMVFPDWDSRIDMGKLNISSGTVCVLGQCYGGYMKGLARLDLSPAGAARCGFAWPALLGTGYSYRKLTEAWRMLIEGRRHVTVQSFE